MRVSIHIEARGDVQGHASVKHHHGGVQDARQQPEHDAERRRLERQDLDDGLLADPVVYAKLHNPQLAAPRFRGFQAVLLGQTLRTSIDTAATTW